MPGNLQTHASTTNEIEKAPAPAAGLEVLLQAAAQLTRSDRGLLILVEPPGRSQAAAHLGMELDAAGFPAAAPASVRQALQSALDGGEPTALPLPGAGGWGAALCLPLRWKGQPTGALYLERLDQPGAYAAADLQIASLCAQQAALILENQRLEAALRHASDAHAQYLSTLTHELRLPMTSIRGYADLLRQGLVGPLNDLQLNFVNVIRNNIERMASLVASISDLSRLDTERLKLNLAPAPLPAALDETLKGLASLVQSKNHTVRQDLPGDLPPLYADPARLAQILGILLDNACRYTPEGGCIQITACQEGRNVRVGVKDNGIGVTPGEQAKLFQAFFRSEDEYVREQPGWGLGLHLAHRLVQAMDGEMGARFDDPPGSEFWFRIPVFSQKASA